MDHFMEYGHVYCRVLWIHGLRGMSEALYSCVPHPPTLPAESAEYLFESSAARPASSNNWCRLAFYNIGWDAKSKKERRIVGETCGDDW